MDMLVWWYDSLHSICNTNWIVRISQRNPRKWLGLCCVASSRKRRQGVGLLQGDSLEKSCHGGHQIVGRIWIYWIQIWKTCLLFEEIWKSNVDIKWYSWIHSWIHSFCFQVWSQPYIIDALYIYIHIIWSLNSTWQWPRKDNLMTEWRTTYLSLAQWFVWNFYASTSASYMVPYRDQLKHLQKTHLEEHVNSNHRLFFSFFL